MWRTLSLLLAVAVLSASCATGRPKGRKGGGGKKKISSGCNCPTFGQVSPHYLYPSNEFSFSPPAKEG